MEHIEPEHAQVGCEAAEMLVEDKPRVLEALGGGADRHGRSRRSVRSALLQCAGHRGFYYVHERVGVRPGALDVAPAQ